MACSRGSGIAEGDYIIKVEWPRTIGDVKRTMFSLRGACDGRPGGDRLGGPDEPPSGPPQQPPRRDDREGDGEGRSGALTLTRTRTKKPSMYKVLMLNDDYTPMEFVVDV